MMKHADDTQLVAVFEIVPYHGYSALYGARHFVVLFEFSLVNFMHYIVHLKYPKCECTYDVPYVLLPYTTMQCSRVFQEEKKKLNNRKRRKRLHLMMESPAFV